jgi:hypothetical protein
MAGFAGGLDAYIPATVGWYIYWQDNRDVEGERHGESRWKTSLYRDLKR